MCTGSDGFEQMCTGSDGFSLLAHALTADVGGTVTRGCDRCLKVLQNGIYQCANCKENYRIATSPKQSSPDVNPGIVTLCLQRGLHFICCTTVLLSEFFGHLQGLGVLEQVVSAIASEQLQARLGLKRAEEEYRGGYLLELLSMKKISLRITKCAHISSQYLARAVKCAFITHSCSLSCGLNETL